MASGQDTPGPGRHRRAPGSTDPDDPAPAPPDRGSRSGDLFAAPEGADDDTDVIPAVPADDRWGGVPDNHPTVITGPATGLAKFDLGSIPASVTPPRTWRRAAWFAVAAASLVLVGLAYAAVTLMTGPRRPDVVDALPGLPSGPQSLVESSTPSNAQRKPRPTASATYPTAPSPTAARPHPAQGSTASSGPPRTTDAQTPSATPHPQDPTPAPPARPTRTTKKTEPLLFAVANADTIGDRTETYYERVVNDPEAAYAMTTGEMRWEGPDSINQRYGDVERVEVQQITIDPNQSTTRSRLRVVHKDGTVTTQERELTFTYGSDPKITEDSRAG